MPEQVALNEVAASREQHDIIARLPSSFALQHEGRRITHDPKPIPFQEIINRLGFSPVQRAVDNIGLHYPDIQKASNIVKTRLAHAAVVHNLVDNGQPIPNNQLSEHAVGMIMSDSAICVDIRSVVETAKRDYRTETAQAKDLSYMRSQGGFALERRFLDGRITKEHAIAIASIFERSAYSLSAIQKAQIINFFVNTPNAPVIKFSSNGIGPDKVCEIILETRLRSKILSNVLTSSFSKGETRDFVPLSNFTGVMKDVMDEFTHCRTIGGLRAWIETVKAKDIIPPKITSLTDVLDVAKNHPELRAVSFDLYDTIVQWTSNQGERRARMDEIASDYLRRKYGLQVDQIRFNRASTAAWDRRWRDYQEKGKEVKIEDTVSWMVDDILADRGVTGGRDLASERDKIVRDLVQSWYRVELETAVPMPGALETLKKLKAMGLKVCLTSNASWSDEHVKRVLNRFDLLSYFDSISISSEMGKMKHWDFPDFFHYSWRKVGALPQQVLHIGDNQWADRDGGSRAGARVSLYENPHAYSDLEANTGFFLQQPEEYRRRSLSYHMESQNKEAVARIDDLMDKYRVPVEERERVCTMAREIYQKSRDVVGPAYITLADHILKKLARGESDLNLCLARDGLPLAVVQKLLLHRERERYNGISADKIRYVHVSRGMLKRIESDPSFRNRYLTYLRQLGVNEANRIILTDNVCVSGKTHESIKKMLPDKHIEGFYMDSHQAGRMPDAHSFLKEATGDDQAYLESQDMLLLFEALYSGPFEPADEMVTGQQDRIIPHADRKDFPREVLIRGLSRESLLLFNNIAIRGIIDSVDTFHRRRTLSLPDLPAKDVMRRFYGFINSKPSAIWEDIWKSVPWEEHGKWKIPSQM